MPSGDALALLVAPAFKITLPTIVITGSLITDAVAAIEGRRLRLSAKSPSSRISVLQMNARLSIIDPSAKCGCCGRLPTSFETRALVGSSPALERVRAAITQVASTVAGAGHRRKRYWQGTVAEMILGEARARQISYASIARRFGTALRASFWSSARLL